MASKIIQYVFNVSGNANDAIGKITQSANILNETVTNTTSVFKGFGGNIIVLQQLSQMFENLKSGMDAVFLSGVSLDSSLADLAPARPCLPAERLITTPQWCSQIEKADAPQA